MKEIKIGMLAKSLAGHDKDRIYVIQSVDEDLVSLVDGVIRTIEKPKTKKRKHIQIIHEQHNIEEMQDFEIKRLIKEYERKQK